MKNYWLVVLNPASGGLKSNTKQQKIIQLLNSAGLNLLWATTQQKGDAIQLVKNKVQEGIRQIIVLGGDGTLNEVINGVMLQKTCSSAEVKIAMLSNGTGNDFIRTFQIPKKTEHAIAMVQNSKVKTIDAGWVSYQINDAENSRYFINILGMGFDGAVTESANSTKGGIGRLTYLKSVLTTLFHYKPSVLKIKIDNLPLISEQVFTLNAGIGRYSGGGMQLVPHASSDDGQLAITLLRPLPHLTALLNLYRLFNGTINHLKQIQLMKGKDIRVEAYPPIMAEAEGEFFGYSPFYIKVIPKAISIIVP